MCLEPRAPGKNNPLVQSRRAYPSYTAPCYNIGS
jgi:hypothetical protein